MRDYASTESNLPLWVRVVASTAGAAQRAFGEVITTRESYTDGFRQAMAARPAILRAVDLTNMSIRRTSKGHI